MKVDGSKAKREASVEWLKKITEAVQKDLGWSGENQLAREENDNAKLQWCTETWETNTEEIDETSEDVDRLPTHNSSVAGRSHTDLKIRDETRCCHKRGRSER